MALLRTSAGGRRWPAVLSGRMAWLILALFCVFLPRASAQTPITNENQIKAVFLFNFAQFVEWPARAFHDADAPLVIGILGEDPFGSYLDELVRGEKIGSRPLVVRRFKRIDDVAECHILFLSRSETSSLDKAIARLKGQCLLTVSDAETFTRLGGMVRFATESGKIRLRINIQAAKASELTISSKILRPATIVTTGKD